MCPFFFFPWHDWKIPGFDMNPFIESNSKISRTDRTNGRSWNLGAKGSNQSQWVRPRKCNTVAAETGSDKNLIPFYIYGICRLDWLKLNLDEEPGAFRSRLRGEDVVRGGREGVLHHTVFILIVQYTGSGQNIGDNCIRHEPSALSMARALYNWLFSLFHYFKVIIIFPHTTQRRRLEFYRATVDLSRYALFNIKTSITIFLDQLSGITTYYMCLMCHQMCLNWWRNCYYYYH